MKLFFTNECGRSMIEMLGVLAIVGILSVGGIAGFNKAMVKYQANQWVSEVLLVFQEFIRYRDDWLKIGAEAGLGENNTVIVNKAMQTMVPSSWVLSSAGNYFHNNKGEEISFFIYNNKKPAMHFALSAEHSKHIEYCVNIFNNILIPYSESVYQLNKYFYKDQEKSSEHVIYGDRYCASDVVCFHDLTINDIIDVCTPTAEEKRTKPVYL